MTGSSKSWWISRDEEDLYGPHTSRDEAIKAGARDYDGDPFYVTRGERFAAKHDIFDIEEIAEAFDNANEDYCGEEGPSISWSDTQGAELVDALNKVFGEWIDRHGFRGLWAIDAEPGERINPGDAA